MSQIVSSSWCPGMLRPHLNMLANLLSSQEHHSLPLLPSTHPLWPPSVQKYLVQIPVISIDNLCVLKAHLKHEVDRVNNFLEKIESNWITWAPYDQEANLIQFGGQVMVST